MKRIKFGKYAGVRIRGDVELNVPSDGMHLTNALWLTAMVESNGKFGGVMNYDGTGVTAGIHQAIAVYPKALDDRIRRNDQGPFWKLLNRVWALRSEPNLYAIKQLIINKMNENGMVLAPNGKCLDERTGKLMSGQRIRKIFSGSSDGVMPERGVERKNAESWVKLFHNLFSMRDTFHAQWRFGEEHTIKRAERAKLRFTKEEFWHEQTIQSACYPKSLALVTAREYGYGWDLALSVYWSHSVNAPGKALRVLCKAIEDLEKMGAKETTHSPVFPKILLKRLGDTKYGRWHRSINGGRYQRTRQYAMRHWPLGLFEGDSAIML